MDKRCPECGMVGFHKMSCSVPYKNREALKENWETLKQIGYYKWGDRK